MRRVIRRVGFAPVLLALLAVALVPLARADSGAEHRVEQARPIYLGTSGNNINDVCSAGTLGSLVHKTVRSTDVQYILSNNHVLARSNAGAVGEGILQPGRLDEKPKCAAPPEDVVATLSEWVTLNFGFSCDTAPTNAVDAAIAQVGDSKVRTDGAILDILTISSDTVTPALNMGVKKSGRTTGLTRGVISGVDVTMCVGPYPGKKYANFTNQIMITPGTVSRAGDSGSLFVEDVSTSNPRAVGLLFAGNRFSTLANPISPVLSSFNASMVGVGASLAGSTSTAGGRGSPGLGLGTGSQGQTAMDAAALVKARHEGAWLRLSGVVGAGVALDHAAGRPVIEVYVVDATPELRRAIPPQVEGISVRVVETGEFLPL